MRIGSLPRELSKPSRRAANLEGSMRAVATSCLLLLPLAFAGAAPAQAQLPVPDCTTLTLCKKVRIINNEPAAGGTTIYVVFQRGAGRKPTAGDPGGDDWLKGLSQTTNPADNYYSQFVYRFYVGCSGAVGSGTCSGI